MKSIDLKFKTMGLIAGMCAITLASCSTDDDPVIPEPEPSVLQGRSSGNGNCLHGLSNPCHGESS